MNTELIAKSLHVAVKAYRAKHPNFVFDEETAEIYIRLLSDLPGETVQAAVLDHISKSEWFPGVSEIRQRTMDIMTPRQLTAYEAWAEVLRVFGAVGERRHDNPLIEKTVRSLGGWKVLGMSENQTADRARFIESYNTFIQRAAGDMITLPQVKEIRAMNEMKLLADQMSAWDRKE